MAKLTLWRGEARRLVITMVCAASAALVHFASGAIFEVTTTADTGAGSLRQAILDANANGTEDRIHFRISGTGVRTISPASPLPPLMEPVVLDGTTQTGYVNKPLIELNGANAGIVSGLRVLANSTIRGLIINRFKIDGIRVEGEVTNVIQGNFIGTDATGTLPRGNAQQGILLMNGGGTVVGGTNAAQRNVISGNGDSGVYILMGGGHQVLGNYIGTTLTGDARLANTNNGVTVYGSERNKVGGSMAGERNVISGNLGSGVYLYGSGSRENVIEGNYIGTRSTGLGALSNAADGITVYSGNANVVGGTNSLSGNLISANGKAGIFLFNANSNAVKGNLIGTDATGNTDLGNAFSGITMLASSNNIVGGAGLAATRNVISGNAQDGVTLMTNCFNNVVQNNFIGINKDGTRTLGNKFSGINLLDAYQNTIGHNSAAGRNVLSGNVCYGVQITGRSTGNSVAGNFIGTDATGMIGVENKASGIFLQAPGNIIGGPALDFRNVISGNSQDGLRLEGRSAANNTIENNFVGTAVLTTTRLMNMFAGIRLIGAPSNTIARNIISGNNWQGIYLAGSTAGYNKLEGNRVGTDKEGLVAVPNGRDGIVIEDGGTNRIGGALLGAGNQIAGNQMAGIYLTNTSDNIIQGNLIGFAADRLTGLGNKYHGVDCTNGSMRNLIGGRLPGEGNLVGFAQTLYSGVRVRSQARGNTIIGNSSMSNGGLGIDLGDYQPTLNDLCDVDDGPNRLQNFPVLMQATRSKGTTVKGTLNCEAGKSCTVQFYANTSCDPGGYGEGELYLGETAVHATSCETPFTAMLAVLAPPGSTITATATDAEGNTSEFSPCVAVLNLPALHIQMSSGNQMTISWPVTAGLVLKQAAALRPPISWVPVNVTPVVSNGVATVTLPVPPDDTFYALMLP